MDTIFSRCVKKFKWIHQEKVNDSEKIFHLGLSSTAEYRGRPKPEYRLNFNSSVDHSDNAVRRLRDGMIVRDHHDRQTVLPVQGT